MSDNYYDRMQSYEKRLSFLEGQTQGQAPKLIDKNVFNEIEHLKGSIKEMKKVVKDFETSFDKQFPAIEKPDTGTKSEIKSSQDNSTGCVKAILIAFIIIVLAFLFIIIQNQQ